MRSILLIAFLLSSLNLQAADQSSLRLANFITQKLQAVHKDRMPFCRREIGGEFHPACNREEHPCVIQDNFYWNKKTKLKVTIPKELTERHQMPGSLKILGLKDQMSFHMSFYDGAFNTDHSSFVPVGVEFHMLYATMLRNQLEIVDLGRHIIPEDGNLKIEKFEIPKHKIRIVKPAQWNPQEYLMINANDFHISQSQSRATELYAPPGKYEIKINLNNNVERFNQSFRKTVELKDQNIIINFERKDFVSNIRENDKLQLSWNPKQITGDSTWGDSFGIVNRRFAEEELFVKLDKLIFTLNGKEEDLRDFFTLHVHAFSLKKDKDEEFQKKIAGIKHFSVRAEGTCERAWIKPANVTHSVYSAPDPKSKIVGSIEIKKLNEGSDLNGNYISLDGKTVVPFTPDFALDDCEGDEVALHWVKEVKGELVNIGKGPWGESGWLKLKTIDPFSSDYKYAFGHMDGEENAKFIKKGNAYELVQWSSDNASTPKITQVTIEQVMTTHRPNYRCAIGRP